MPLEPCRECGKTVSRSAASCPHCGVAWPVVQKGKKPGKPPLNVGNFIKAIFFLGFAGVVLTMCGVFEETPSASKAPAETTPVASAVSPCHQDWKRCDTNASLVNNYEGYSGVRSQCEEEATKEANYGTPKFPSFWSGGSFASFRGGSDYVTTGIVTAIEPDAQFSNGFGAMVHSTVTCIYDLGSGTVRSIVVTPNAVRDSGEPAGE
jgi:hypothetical protein